MFSVVIKRNKTHRQVVFSAISVEFTPAEASDTPGLFLYQENEKSIFLATDKQDDEDWRDVFVMNEQGQTVARYVL